MGCITTMEIKASMTTKSILPQIMILPFMICLEDPEVQSVQQESFRVNPSPSQESFHGNSGSKDEPSIQSIDHEENHTETSSQITTSVKEPEIL